MRAADFLNITNVDVLCVEHEFGIFGGTEGSHVLALLRELRMPIVTTLSSSRVDDPVADAAAAEAEAAPGDQVGGIAFLRDALFQHERRGRAVQAEHLGVLRGADQYHLDRRLEGVLGQHLDEVLTSRHRGRVVLSVQELDTHRSRV